jgi:outer membrane protein TolC
MSKLWPRQRRQAVWLLLLFVCGCTSARELCALVVPEQVHLEVRQPEQIASYARREYPPPPTVSSPGPPLVASNLSLDDAIRIALANANVIRVLAGATVTSSLQTVYDPAISNTSIDVARAAFDPTLTVTNTIDRLDDPLGVLAPTRPLGALITAVDTHDYTVKADLSQRNVLGGTVDLTFLNSYDRFRPGVFPLNPQDTYSLALSYTQPLLKGAGVAYNVAPIVIARLNTERSYFQFKDSVQELVRGVIEAYWDVVFARIDVWAKRQQVEQGEEGFRFADAKQRVGQGNAADVAQARVALSNFKANLVGAEGNLLQREAALRNILGLPPTEPPIIVPTTAPMPIRVEPRWRETVLLAEDRRPDLIELQLVLDADLQSLLQAKNQAQVQVDASVYYKWNGLEGQTPSGATISTTAGQFADWSVGVNFSVPLGLRQSRAALRSAELIIAKDRANVDQGLHAAVHELADSFRNLDQHYEQYRAFKETREAARENLKQQLAVYKSGIGKTGIYLNVLQAISDWGNAISSEAQALTQYNIDLATLERRTGTILETHGVWFFEERYRSMGPFGRFGLQHCYPAAVIPGPNGERYPAGNEPAERSFQMDTPSIPRNPTLEEIRGNGDGGPSVRAVLQPPKS